jgi:hypothetical protein
MTQGSPTTGELVARLRDRTEGTGIWRTAGPDEDLQALVAAVTTLERELEEARATNRKLNRDAQLAGRTSYRNAKAYIRSLYGELTKRRTAAVHRARRALQSRYPEDAGITVDVLAERMAARATASQAEVERLREALKNAADRAQQAVNTMQFNAKHMIAEDSLQDAWKMLELAKQQFSTDAVSVQEAVDIARAAIQVEESKP